MSVELLELAADALGPELVAEVAFLGAATIGLWITEPAAPAPRPTRDVDVIVDVVSRVGYYRLGEALRAREFDENAEARQTCAWKHRQTSLELDVMPTDEEILGFSNRWYADALRDTVEVELPSGTTIRAVSPPYLLATKLEAFNGRGRDPRGDPDFLGSRDFGDVVVLIDGRTELVNEVRAATPMVRMYIADEFARLREDVRFEGGIAGALLPDNASQARRALVAERVEQIIAARPA